MENKNHHSLHLQPNFDINRYLGKWYQIAALPTFFQKNCANSTAEYGSTKNPNIISVYNQCFNKQGQEINSIKGTATPKYVKQPAALIVQFPGFPSNKVNYLVHETNYTGYAIVGSPDRKDLFFLARSKSVSQQSYDYMLQQANKLGYNTQNIIIDQNAINQTNYCWLWWILLIIIIIIIIFAAYRYMGRKY